MKTAVNMLAVNSGKSKQILAQLQQMIKDPDLFASFVVLTAATCVDEKEDVILGGNEGVKMKKKI